MGSNFARIPYAGGTPGADSNTYVLFDSRTAGAALRGLPRYLFSSKNSAGGLLKGEASDNGGSSWHQFFERYVPPSTTRRTNDFAVRIDIHPDVKFSWVNQGVAQNPWYVAQILDDGSLPIHDMGADAFTYIVNGNMQTGFVGPDIYPGPEGLLLAEMAWTNTGAPNGTLVLKGTLDGLIFKPVRGAEAEFAATGNAQPNNNNGDNVCFWRNLQIYKRLRLEYAGTGGTGNTSFSARVSTR